MVLPLELEYRKLEKLEAKETTVVCGENVEEENEGDNENENEDENENEVDEHETRVIHGTRFRVKGPKIPPFEESKDAIDAYLHCFEIYAKAQKWNWQHSMAHTQKPPYRRKNLLRKPS